MALILAIEPDRRQAAQLTSLIRARVDADLVLAETAEQALNAIGDRVPDLVLVPALLAPQDDATLAGALRVIAVAARIQMLTIPVLAATSRRKQPRGVLAKWRRRRAEPAASEGCDPAMFGDQIAAYLAEAAAERAVNESDRLAAAPVDAPMDEAPAHLIAETPVGEAAGVDATVHTGLFPGVPAALGGEQVPVDERRNELAAGTASIADVPLPQAGGDVEPWVPLSFAPQQDLEGPVADPSIAGAAVPAGGFAAVEVAGEDLPMAIDAISLSTSEDAWDTEEQTEFFTTTFHDGELSVEEPTVYELQTDDLSMDVLSFDEPPIETPRPIHDEATHHGLAALPSAIDIVAASELVSAQPESLELWMPLSFGAQRRWPDLEGMVGEEPAIARLVIAASPVTVGAVAVRDESPAPVAVRVEPPAAPPRPAVAATAPPSKPEWLELIESLRKDVERLRGEHTQPPSVAAATRHNEAPQTAALVTEGAEVLPLPRTPPIVDIGTRSRKRPGPAKPVQDEWGFFDPEQCGFAALLAKLDEITHLNDGA
jgi:hypothetical protein